MAIFSFGEYIEGKSFKVLDERKMRGSAGIMFLSGIIAFINGFILQNYIAITYISGFLLANFAIGLFVNPKFSPTVFISALFVRKQSPLPIGAVQKKFAWSLGFILAAAIFTLSWFLLTDVAFFEPVCMLCLICLILLFLETAFGICVGCKLYFLFIKLKLIKQPEEKPNCMGDSCEI
jgi:hypothetical protein